MIQRIQSIFLLLAGASFGSLFGLSFATSEKATAQFLADKTYNINDHVLLLVMVIVAILVSIGGIFLYKNRGLQLRMGYFSIVLSILIPLLAFGLFYGEASSMMSTGVIDDQLGLYMPILSFIFSFLAVRFIGKDEKLVKSMDRLR